ncbi:MAG: hypothetical protein HY770_03015 [Chitinivibrionia bacterium]|nr:hypothetical protein [Chitinivibrionia bacterium]
MQRYSLIAIAVLAFVHLGIQLTLLSKGVEFVVANLTIDDTYYYLQTAWNTARAGTVSFDGIHSTNGVQLLWFWIVAAIAVFVKTKTAFLCAVLIACFILNVLCYFAIWRIGTVLHSAWLSLLIALFWSVEVFSGTYFIGVENSLHALVIWCVIWQLAAVAAADEVKARRHFYILTVLLIANVWTRLDAALFSLFIFVFSMALLRVKSGSAEAFSARYGKAAALCIVAAIAGMAGMFLAYRMMGGSMLPVSALIKLTSQRETGSLLERMHENYTFSIPHILAAPLRTDTMRAAIGGGSLVAAFGFGGFSSSGLSGDRGAARIVLLGLLIPFAAYAALVVALKIWNADYFVWYRSPLYIFWIFTFAFALTTFFDGIAEILARPLAALKGWRSSEGAIAGRIGVILMLAISAATLSHCGIGFSKRMKSSTLNTACGVYYDTARWMDENLPDTAVCAAWNAGVVGYFSERRVINLDGLVNGIDYYKTVLRGDTELEMYLRQNNVEYIADYIDYESILPSLALQRLYASPPDKWGRVVMKVSEIER